LIFCFIWVFASLINGVLLMMSIICFGGAGLWWLALLVLTSIMSFFCSAPFVFVSWVIGLALYRRGKRGRELYLEVLSISFYAGLIAAFSSKLIFDNFWKPVWPSAALSIITASVGSVIILRKQLQSIV